jgi:hypothetical protein
MNWIDMVEDRDKWRALVNTLMNLRVTLSLGKFMISYITGGFSRRAQLRGVSYTTSLPRKL